MIPSFSMEWQLFSEMEPWEVPMLLCCCGALTFFVLLGPHVHQIIITCSCCHYLHMTWHWYSWSCEIQPSHHFQWNDNHLVKWKRLNVPPHVLLLLLLLIITCLCCNYLQVTSMYVVMWNTTLPSFSMEWQPIYLVKWNHGRFSAHVLVVWCTINTLCC